MNKRIISFVTGIVMALISASAFAETMRLPACKSGIFDVVAGQPLTGQLQDTKVTKQKSLADHAKNGFYTGKTGKNVGLLTGNDWESEVEVLGAEIVDYELFCAITGIPFEDAQKLTAAEIISVVYERILTFDRGASSVHLEKYQSTFRPVVKLQMGKKSQQYWNVYVRPDMEWTLCTKGSGSTKVQPTETPKPTVEPTPVPTSEPTPTPSVTPTITEVPVITPEPTAQPTPTATPVVTPVITEVPIQTATPAPEPTPTPVVTPVITEVPIQTATPAPQPTATPYVQPVITEAPIQTATPAPKPTATPYVQPVITEAPIQTATPAPAATPYVQPEVQEAPVVAPSATEVPVQGGNEDNGDGGNGPAF